MVLEKEIKKYKKGKQGYSYTINLNKTELSQLNIKNLETENNIISTVYILPIKEYDKLNNNNDKNTIESLETKIKHLNNIIKDNANKLENITKLNNENINQLNQEYTEKLEKLTTLNTILITGLETIKKTSLIDRLTNKNKQIATKIINENIKQLPSKEFELKEKKRRIKQKPK